MANIQPGSATRSAPIKYRTNEPEAYWRQVALEFSICSATTSSGEWDVYSLDKRFQAAQEADDLIEQWRVIFDGKRAIGEMRHPPDNEVRQRVEQAYARLSVLAGFKSNTTGSGRSRRDRESYDASRRLRATYEEELGEQNHDLDAALALSCDRRRRLDTDYGPLDALIAIVKRRVGDQGEPIKPTARALGKWPQTIRNWLAK